MKKVVFALVCLCAGVVLAATEFSGRVVVLPNWTHTKTVGASTLTETFGNMLSWTHTTGTNANQMSTITVTSGSLTNGQSTAIDLTSSVNGFGDSVSFSTVRFMAVKAYGSTIDVGGSETNRFDAWTGGTNGLATVRPGGMLLLVAPDETGYAVGTNGILKITNTETNTATFEVYVGGSE